MPDSTLALADFAAKLAMLYYRTGHDPGGFRAAGAMEITRLAHKQYGVNDDTERDRDLETLETLARQLECDLDLDNKALNPWDEYFNPLPIPRLDEPAAPEPYRAIIADLRGRLIAIRAIVSILPSVGVLDVLTADLPALEGRT